MALWTLEYMDTALWLDAADWDTITESSGAVSQWADKSGNDRHATQAIGGYQPSVLSAALNGLDVILFASDALSLATEISDVRAVFFITDDLIGDQNPSFPYVAYLCSGATHSSYYVFVRIDDGYDDISIDGSVSASGHAGINGGTPVAGTNIELGASVADKTGPALWYADWDASQPVKHLLSYGTERFGKGRVGEIILLASVPSDADRQRIEGYLAHKWGLAANLPSEHTYKTDAPTINTIGNTSPTVDTVACFDTSWNLIATQTTDASGNWSMDLPDGDYYFVYSSTGKNPVCHGPYTIS